MRFTTFADRVLGLRFTRGQRVLALVSFDGLDPIDLEGDERDLALHMFAGAERIPSEARQVLALELGRDSGKSTIATAFALFAMVTTDLTSRGPGDVPVVPLFSTRLKNARHLLRIARALVEGSAQLRNRVTEETADAFVLRRPDKRLVSIECFAMSNGGASVRSRSNITVIVDEAEFLRSDDVYAATDRELRNAVAPRLLGPYVQISTRWPAKTLMREFVDKNLGNPTTALAARADTLTMRDHAPSVAATIERERQIDEANMRREFFCDDTFSGADGWFDSRAVKACVDLELACPAAPKPFASVFFGADVGLIRDSSALVGVEREGDVYTVVCLDEKRPKRGEPLKLSSVVGDSCATVIAYGARSFVADGFNREPAREFATEHHVEIEAAPEGTKGKQDTYTIARKLIAEGRVRLPNHPRLIEQLASVVAKPLEGGGLRFVIPRRAGLAHGDLVSALVLALWKAEQLNADAWFADAEEEDACDEMFAHGFGTRF